MAIKDDDAMEIMEALTVGLHPGSTDVSCGGCTMFGGEEAVKQDHYWPSISLTRRSHSYRLAAWSAMSSALTIW